MNKVTEERRREIGTYLYEVAKALKGIRKELGITGVTVGSYMDAWAFMGTTEDGAGGLYLNKAYEDIVNIFIDRPKVCDECSVTTLEKAHECFGWDFPVNDGEVAE